MKKDIKRNGLLSGEIKLLMFGVAVPDNIKDILIKVDKDPQIQTHKLIWSIINGIEEEGQGLDILSTIAISDYPKAKWLFVGYRRWPRKNRFNNIIVPFVNVIGIKQVTRFCSGLLFLIVWLIKNRRSDCHVLQYGLISSHLLAVNIAKKMFDFRSSVVITDLPGMAVANDGYIKKSLRSLDWAMVMKFIGKIDGVIALTRQIAHDYAPKKPSLVMEGIVSMSYEKGWDDCVNDESNLLDSDEFIIMYAGGLQKQYGVQMLLDAFNMIEDQSYRLWLLGSGEMDGVIRNMAKKDKRIYYPGFIRPEELLLLIKKATVLVNARLSSQEFTKYSFPSKIIEYMASGRPVITTRLASIPKEYNPFLIWLDDETPAGLVNLLRSINGMSKEQLNEIGKKGMEFVMKEKNFKIQGKRIVDFIHSIS